MDIYQPAEDSYLLTDILKKELPFLLNKNPDLTFLEIGAGSGIHLETALKSGIKKQNIFSSDINPAAVRHCNILGFNCVESDLFDKINGEFDIIIFNPPYLPLDLKEPKESQLATTGGKKGSEIIIRFLKQVKDHLKKNSRIFLLTSSLTPEINFSELGYNERFLGNEKLFYEELFVWELKLIE